MWSAKRRNKAFPTGIRKCGKDGQSISAGLSDAPPTYGGHAHHAPTQGTGTVEAQLRASEKEGSHGFPLLHQRSSHVDHGGASVGEEAQGSAFLPAHPGDGTETT